MSKGRHRRALVGDMSLSQSDRQTGQLARDHHDLFFPVWSGARTQQSVCRDQLTHRFQAQPLPKHKHTHASQKVFRYAVINILIVRGKGVHVPYQVAVKAFTQRQTSALS